MTRLLAPLLLAVPLALALPACKGDAQAPTRAPVALVMDVHGMTCGSCESAITSSLLALDGVSEARAAHAEAKVWVTYDPDAQTPEQLKATIDGLGYNTAGWSTEP